MSPARRRMARALTGSVLAVMLTMVGLATMGTRQIVKQEERQLLAQRADELAVYLAGVTQGLGAQLGELADLARFDPDPAQGFLRATALVPAPAARVRALLHEQGPSSYLVLAAAGAGLATGEVVTDPAITGPAGAAQQSPSFVFGPVTRAGGQRVLTLALGRRAPAGDVVIQQNVVSGQPTAARSGPYSELNVALYDGTRPLASSLVLTTAPISSFRGPTSRKVAHLGASPLLVVASARSTLVGGVALNAQWFVLGLGLGLTCLLGALFEASQRRRDYALELVEDRTAALNESLETLRRTQDQLVESERLAAIGQLASTVGHELRNPLAVITNALYLLRRATASSPEPRIAQHLATAEREVTAATLIVSDLLEFSRSRRPMAVRVDLGDLVDETLSIAPHPDNVEVDWHPPESPVWAWADRDQLRQVLLNLVTNSYDAMPDGGNLRLALAPDDAAHSRIEVQDSGTGMDAGTMERIYEPFFTTKARGVGLGLAVTSRIVAAHGGRLEVDSEPGRGTRFTVRLPESEPVA